MNRFLPLTLCVAITAARGAEPVRPPASVRFANETTTEVPDLQRHVLPLLGRLGCNGRACHGSFQGRGGFRLSLFGSDFENDHRALVRDTGDVGERRVRLQDPEASLLLRKPTLVLPHDGGDRFEWDGWEYRLLERWIAAGAAPVEKSIGLRSLTVSPAELVAEVGAEQSLTVVATWPDGTREDVTPLCRFQSNDDSVATVDVDGHVRITGPGDTHVVVFYDNAVVSQPVVVPYPAPAEAVESPLPGPTVIDRLVEAKLGKLGVVPSPLCTDAEFLRRVSIDLTGTLPTPSEVESFLADDSADKRTRKIDELLERPTYAAWWANKLCDFTGCNPQQQSELGQEFSVRWYGWLYRRVAENVPYDDIVQGLVVANGRGPGESYEEYAESLSACFRETDPTDFADRETMPLFWSRRTLDEPRDRALAFAHAFLGVRLDCAECHKHPYDVWTQGDFREVASLFGGLNYGVSPDSRAEYQRIAESVGVKPNVDRGMPIRDDLLVKAIEGRTIPWRELHWRGNAPIPARVLGIETEANGGTGDPRAVLMSWLRRPDNPWFARVFVNRVWGNYFHRGIVEPTDDLNPANPPSNAPLLDWLATEFVARDYDMKWLHRTITSSHAYQRSWRPNATNAGDRRNFSRAIPRRLPAEVLYDALKQVTAAEHELDEVRLDLDRRAIGHLSMRMAGTYAMRVFGKPERATNCDCERNDDPSLLQAVFLQNDPLVRARLESSAWLAEADDRSVSPEAFVHEAYLRAVGRPPDDSERARAVAHVRGAASPREGYEDLLWVLVNTKEFLLNH